MRKSRKVITACLMAALFAVPAVPALSPKNTAVVYADEQDEIEEIKRQNEENEEKKAQAEDELASLNISADEVRDTIRSMNVRTGLPILLQSEMRYRPRCPSQDPNCR